MDQSQPNTITNFICQISADVLALEQETEGLLRKTTQGVAA